MSVRVYFLAAGRYTLMYRPSMGVGLGAQSTLGGDQIFARKIYITDVKISKIPEFYMILARKIIKIQEFLMIFARKKLQNSEFYMIFARKCPNFTY